MAILWPIPALVGRNPAGAGAVFWACRLADIGAGETNSRTVWKFLLPNGQKVLPFPAMGCTAKRPAPWRGKLDIVLSRVACGRARQFQGRSWWLS